LYFLIWTVIGLFFFSQAIAQKFVSREPTPWWHYLVSWMVGVNIWAILTPGLLWLGNRFPIERRNRLRRIALHLLFSIGISLGQLLTEGWLVRI
jgi:hypothetical protein